MPKIDSKIIIGYSNLSSLFSIIKFFDEFMNGGIIPISLTRWELTGKNSPNQF